MKIRPCNSFKIVIVLAAALISAWSATAQNVYVYKDMESSAGSSGTNGIYLSADAGLAIMQNMTSQGVLNGVIQYHVGPRFDVSMGYNLKQSIAGYSLRNIAVELQAGVVYNSWSAQDGKSVAPGNSAHIWAVPVMASGIYKYPFGNHWFAYGGLGAGALISTLDITVPGQHPQDFNSTDWTFGYQAMLGIKCIFDERFEWGIGYKFLGSLDHHWSDSGFGVRMSPTYNHSILASLTYRF